MTYAFTSKDMSEPRATAATAKQPQHERAARKTAAKPRILLLEDDGPNAFLFQAFLDKIGIPEADHAKTIAEATLLLPKIQDGQFDLVVLDIMLPDGESYALAETITASSDTPVFAYTARVAPQDLARMDQCGFAQIIQKPSAFDVFVKALASQFPSLDPS